ncbi:MAG: 4'-phosphopantetheinyl transferase family protein [Planctomycetota bacterium]
MNGGGDPWGAGSGGASSADQSGASPPLGERDTPKPSEGIPAWREPPAALSLAIGDLHVWRASLDLPDRSTARLASHLTPGEREGAERAISPTLRTRRVASRGILRALLGRYLERDPGDVELAIGEHGRPRLAAGPAEGPISFNLSHSGGLALYAFARERTVGIDIENVRPTVDHQGVAARSFSAAERAVLSALPEDERLAAFFRCWTRKEAYLKAKGGGISLRLDGFDVSLAPGEPPALLASRLEQEGPCRWRLIDIDAGPGCVAAVILEHCPGDPEPRLETIDFSTAR